MKFGKSQLKKSTPAKLRKLGNALVAASTAGAGIAFVTDHQAVAVTVLALAMLGRGLVEFFGEDEQIG